ncbi:hypothetical protein ACP4OV_010744 [Aristida adscensionis]
MCPPIHVLAVLDISITDSWSDEELVRFLAERKAEDPLPHNVFAGMDFFIFDPQSAKAGDLWFLNWSDDQQPHVSAENGIRNTENGYWKPVDSSKVPTSTTIMGVKIVLEFYEGQAPCGKRTGWVMHEYQVEQNVEANIPQDYKSLCTVFLQGDKNSNAKGRQNSLNADAPNNGLESYLQYLARIEEPKTLAAEGQNTSSSKGHREETSAADIFAADDVFASGDYIELNDLLSSEACDDGQDDTSSRKGHHEQKTRTTDDIAVSDAFATGEFIELNDLLSSEASASTSENSSKRSMISEEYFDSDAFLREILKNSSPTDGEQKDSKFSIAAPTKLDNVVISPSEQAFVHIHDNNATVTGTSEQKGLTEGNKDQHPNKGFQQHSPVSCFPSSHVKRSCPSSSNSSQGSTRSPQRGRSTSKLGKIGRYFCLGSF